MVTRDNEGPDILLPGGATLQQSVAAVVCRYQQTECGPRASHCSTAVQAWSAELSTAVAGEGNALQQVPGILATGQPW